MRTLAGIADSIEQPLLVAALARTWNHYRLPTGGKIVYAELTVPPVSTQDDTQEPPHLTPLPPHARAPEPGQSVQPIEVRNPQLIRQVLDDLYRIDSNNPRGEDR